MREIKQYSGDLGKAVFRSQNSEFRRRERKSIIKNRIWGYEYLLKDLRHATIKINPVISMAMYTAVFGVVSRKVDRRTEVEFQPMWMRMGTQIVPAQK